MSVSLRDTRFDHIKAQISFAIAGHDPHEAGTWAENRWGAAGRPTAINRSAEGAISTTGIGVGQPLLDSAIFAAVRDQAILFRLKGARRTSFNTRAIVAGGTTASWIDEGAAMPAIRPTFDVIGIDAHKVGGLTVATREALETARDIEATIFAEISAAVVDQLDLALLDPANDGTGAAPASLTSAVTAVTSTANPATDLAALLATFSGDLRSAYFAMSAVTAAKLAGTEVGRDIGTRGGDLLGVPVLTGRAVPDNVVALIDPASLQVAHDDFIHLSTSEAGAIEADDAPTGDSTEPTPATLISLYQSNSIAFRGLLFAGWKKARPGGVAVLTAGASGWLA